jgi:hypothetical protein
MYAENIHAMRNKCSRITWAAGLSSSQATKLHSLFQMQATMQMFIGMLNDIDMDCSSGNDPQTREGKCF